MKIFSFLKISGIVFTAFQFLFVLQAYSANSTLIARGGERGGGERGGDHRSDDQRRDDGRRNDNFRRDDNRNGDRRAFNRGFEEGVDVNGGNSIYVLPQNTNQNPPPFENDL